MQAQQALEKKPGVNPLFVEAEKLYEQLKDFTQLVANRAYDLFESRGREIGHELEDWFRAEFELMRWVPVEMREEEAKLIVRAEVPGFKVEEIKVSIEPNQLTIGGKKETKTEETAKEGFYSEFRANQFCRTLNLPITVTTTKPEATLKDGVLEIILDKAPVSQPVDVAVKAT